MKLQKLGILAAGLLGVEGAARWSYQGEWGVAFEPKVIGEYPYSELLEEVPAPWHYRLKSDFRSRMVNINSHRLRSPVYRGEGKRLLVIGESTLFGTKLRDENQNWPWRLDRLLKEYGRTDWQVLNASFPGYGVTQYKAWWDQELKHLKPDRVLLSIGNNDFSRAYSQGSKWEPDVPWPLDFILALKRPKPWHQKLLGYSAAYQHFRRGRSGQNTSFFHPQDSDYQEQRCTQHVMDTVLYLVEEARSLGAEVAFLGGFPAYDTDPSRAQWKGLGALQGNWEMVVEHDLRVSVAYRHRCEAMLKAHGVPYLPIHQYFLAQPQRTRLYLDLIHLSGRGMSVLTRALYEELKRLGWW